MTIVFLGLGGVGGFYGGKMAARYATSGEVSINFIARGAHLQAIKAHGLRVISDEGEFTAHPDKVTDNPAEIGTADFLIVSTKSYDLADSIRLARPCIGTHTVILPLLNGGDITERIRELLPQNTVWMGCTYVVSRRTEPGVIRQVGHYAKMVFGSDSNSDDNRLSRFDQLLKGAGIDSDCPVDIRAAIWKKFYFISVSASLTSYFNVGFNALADAGEREQMTVGMAEEFLQVARAEGLAMEKYNPSEMLKHLKGLPQDTTTSMHSDFKCGHRTEVETLTGIVVQLARQHGISVPLYQRVYEKLKD